MMAQVDLYEVLHNLSKHYGDNCSNCKEVCCVNKILKVNLEDIQKMSKLLGITLWEFRKKYTTLLNTFLKEAAQTGKKILSVEKETEEKNIRILKFISTEAVFNLGEKKVKASYCPFYARDTHRCTIHDSRPKACRHYPYRLMPDDETFEVRKVSTCIISDNFLRRFVKVISSFKDVKTITDKIEKDLKSKQYFDHYPIPKSLVERYIKYEISENKVF